MTSNHPAEMPARRPAGGSPRRALLRVCILIGLMLGLASSYIHGMDRPAGRTALAIHGGAGTILRTSMTPEREAAYRAAIEEALRSGHSILAEGGSSLDAVVAAVRVMEDSPLFNAGRGAVYTADEKHELDACVMDGAGLRAGAVAAVTRVRNPVELARMVMEQSPHVLLVGEGAEHFARQQGLAMVDNRCFDTPERLEQLRRVKEKEKSPATAPASSDRDRHGTVGAVALDRHGNLAAATSTGGMTNKQFGRVGDSPLVGAGTWADNETCAVSATGHGEYLIRLVIAHEVSSQMRHANKPLAEAASAAIERLTQLKGTGGIIAIDGRGNIAMPFNTEGMYRGSIDADGTMIVDIYRD
jgi:L-asparaginase / beta-aspartyl-peptidase